MWGLERGYCLMIGGDRQVVDMLDPIFDTLAPGFGTIARTPGRDSSDDRAERGYIHAGPAGAGHFVKMVHNGIEYGLMQAYAEGFDILQRTGFREVPEEERFDLNLPDIAEVWRRGSVISSWLLDLCALELARDHGLDQFSAAWPTAAKVNGRWMLRWKRPFQRMCWPPPCSPDTAAATDHGFADKLLSAMRFGFGGHVEPPKA